jgi:hypothetical protein
LSEYIDWESRYQDVYDDIPGIGLLDDYETGPMEQAFYTGFIASTDDVGFEERQAAREEFFDLLGLPEEMFPWHEWAEAMGYE